MAAARADGVLWLGALLHLLHALSRFDSTGRLEVQSARLFMQLCSNLRDRQLQSRLDSLLVPYNTLAPLGALALPPWQLKLPEAARTHPFRKAPGPLHRCGSGAGSLSKHSCPPPTYRTLDAAATLAKRWAASNPI